MAVESVPFTTPAMASKVPLSIHQRDVSRMSKLSKNLVGRGNVVGEILAWGALFDEAKPKTDLSHKIYHTEM